MKVLVIDDSQVNHKLARFHLEKGADYHVESALNGMDGIEMALTGMPDVIILDVDMPELDGKETLRALKRMKQTRHIPVIMAGTDRSYDMKDKLIAMGAKDFIRKNDELHRLCDKIRVTFEPSKQPA